MKVDGKADIWQYNDYYPYGSLAQSGGVGYRYDYQGAYAEKDPLTGFNNFALRMYDGRIGRWLTTDPADQFASPYEGMGNNPVMAVDNDGRFVVFDTFIAAGAGFIIGAGINIGAQLITGTKFSDINWKSAGISGLQGAATGALASIGVPLITNISSNAILGAVADYADQKYAQNKSNVSIGHVLGAGLTNGVAAGFSGTLFANVRNNALWQNVNKNFIERAAIYSKSLTASAFDGIANFANSVFWDELNKARSNSLQMNMNQMNFNLMNQNLGNFNRVQGYISFDDAPRFAIPFSDGSN